MYSETVTIDEAIKKGRRQLFFVPMILLVTVAGAGMGTASFLNNGSMWVAVAGFAGLFGGPVVALLYMLLMVPRWQIWAFDNVRNVHELKQRAILGQFFPKDSSFLWRLMIMNAAQKEEIARLQLKFEQPDEFINDPTLPDETTYAYGKVMDFFYGLFCAAFLIGAIVSLVSAEYMTGSILLAGFATFGWQTYKRLRDSGPILTISNDGITTKDNGFHAWSEIHDERITFTNAGRASYYALEYEVNGNPVKMVLTELTGLSSGKIDPILRTYRGRYENGKRRSE